MTFSALYLQKGFDAALNVQGSKLDGLKAIRHPSFLTVPQILSWGSTSLSIESLSLPVAIICVAAIKSSAM